MVNLKFLNFMVCHALQGLFLVWKNHWLSFWNENKFETFQLFINQSHGFCVQTFYRYFVSIMIRGKGLYYFLQLKAKCDSYDKLLMNESVFL